MVLTKEDKLELDLLKMKHAKVCIKLEQLNEQAIELEQSIAFFLHKEGREVDENEN